MNADITSLDAKLVVGTITSDKIAARRIPWEKLVLRDARFPALGEVGLMERELHAYLAADKADPEQHNAPISESKRKLSGTSTEQSGIEDR